MVINTTMVRFRISSICKAHMSFWSLYIPVGFICMNIASKHKIDAYGHMAYRRILLAVVNEFHCKFTKVQSTVGFWRNVLKQQFLIAGTVLCVCGGGGDVACRVGLWICFCFGYNLCSVDRRLVDMLPVRSTAQCHWPQRSVRTSYAYGRSLRRMSPVHQPAKLINRRLILANIWYKSYAIRLQCKLNILQL